MTYITSKQIFYINSRDKLNPTDTESNFTCRLNIDPHEEFDRVVVLSCSIPKSYYLVQVGENSFTLEEGTDQATVTFPPGNYNRSSLASTLKNQLNLSSPNGWIYSVTYDNINLKGDSGKFYVTVTNNTDQPKFIFGDELAEQLGFATNKTYTFDSNNLVSEYVCNLSLETTLYLHSDICQNSEGNNVLQEIYSNGEATYSYINFQNNIPHEYSKKMALKNSSDTYNFSLRNENGHLVDTNGININFTIMVFKLNDIDRLIKKAIKYFVVSGMISENPSS